MVYDSAFWKSISLSDLADRANSVPMTFLLTSTAFNFPISLEHVHLSTATPEQSIFASCERIMKFCFLR